MFVSVGLCFDDGVGFPSDLKGCGVLIAEVFAFLGKRDNGRKDLAALMLGQGCLVLQEGGVEHK